MDSNFISFCFAFFLLVHMSMGIFTGSRNSDKFTINKIAPSSTGEKNVEKPVIRSKRGFDYSDYFSGSSEENNFGYYHKPQYQAFPSHWPHHAPHHVLLPTSNTGGYDTWQQGPSRPPYHHGKYHLYFHDKKYVSKNRKRRNTISVDDVDDQENDAVFPSRPLFISKGHTGSPKPIAIPLSVGTENVPNEQGHKNYVASSDKTPEYTLIPTISYEFHDQVASKSSTNQRNGYSPSDTASYNVQYSTPPPSRSFDSQYSPSYYNNPTSSYPYYHPPPPPPPPHHHHPPPPHHRHPPPPHHHHPPPPHHHHYPPPPPPPYHGHHPPPPPPPYYGHYPPPPPPPSYYSHYPPPPPPHSQRYYQYEYAPQAHSSTYTENQDNNTTKRSDLNGKIQDIFGSSSVKEYPTIPIDIRIKK